MISVHSSIDVIPFGVGLILQQDTSQYTCMQIQAYRTCRVQQVLGRILKAILLKDVGNDFESKTWWTLAISFWVHSWMQSFPELPFFLIHPWSLRWFQGPLRRWRPIQKWCTLAVVFWCLVFYWMFFHKSQIYVGLSFPQSPIFVVYFFYPGALAAMRVVQKQWSVISYHSVMVSPWFCWFPLRLEEGHW